MNSISHDLCTPLATITGAVTSLLAEGSSYSQETRGVLLLTIKDGVQHMNRYVTNLLDMTRLESGILKLNQEWCDIRDVVGVALKEIQEILQEQQLQIDIPRDLPLVRVDFALMEHVMINLLENAAKYSPPDGSINISARPSNGSLLVQSFLRLTVGILSTSFIGPSPQNNRVEPVLAFPYVKGS